ncbi:prepilin peptidase [Anaerovibrio sp.]|uniref:prepilin peptidase n=1 Tax=Anaerovibrio sp. TaxID=1872532 RepID=UPI003F16B9CE
MATGSREIGRQLWQHRRIIAAVLVTVFLCELILARNAMELCRLAACTALMVPAAVLDSIYGKLYHRWSACMVAVGLIFAAVIEVLGGGGYLALAAGGGMLFFALMLAVFLLSRGGMGFGDVCFAAGAGVFAGWDMVPMAFWLTFLLGGLMALKVYMCSMFKDRKTEKKIPLGPFLTAGSLLAMLYGQEMLRWYADI